MKADEISTRLLDFWQGRNGFRSVICIMITVADVSICASIFKIEIEIRENNERFTRSLCLVGQMPRFTSKGFGQVVYGDGVMPSYYPAPVAISTGSLNPSSRRRIGRLVHGHFCLIS